MTTINIYIFNFNYVYHKLYCALTSRNKMISVISLRKNVEMTSTVFWMCTGMTIVHNWPNTGNGKLVVIDELYRLQGGIGLHAGLVDRDRGLAGTVARGIIEFPVLWWNLCEMEKYGHQVLHFQRLRRQNKTHINKEFFQVQKITAKWFRSNYSFLRCRNLYLFCQGKYRERKPIVMLLHLTINHVFVSPVGDRWHRLTGNSTNFSHYKEEKYQKSVCKMRFDSQRLQMKYSRWQSWCKENHWHFKLLVERPRLLRATRRSQRAVMPLDGNGYLLHTANET